MKNATELLRELNNTDENQKIEAKSGVGNSLLETICAYANEPNMGGGYIIVGAERRRDTLFPLYDVCDLEDCDKLSSDIASQCASVFNIPIRPSIETQEVGGKKVLVIKVSELSPPDKPLYFKKHGLPKGAFRRIGSTDQSCTEEDLVSMFSQRGIKSYDESVIDGATFNDIDPEAIEYYRDLRKRINATAEELKWSDKDLLISLSAVIEDNSILKPTLTGILLFGNRKALRRFLPMSRVDYIRVPGKEWVENPDERFSTTDMRGSLLLLVKRIQDQILEDLPKPFSLEEGDIQARSQSLPAKVLREAIVNALMHSSYRSHQPIQIIRYSNRIEICNQGYSLKNEDQLGEPGSKSRNPHIAAIFHETNLAETKGSGIRTMRKLMEENGFAPPTFESDRENDFFVARLLLHHFLTTQDMNWLGKFSQYSLNDSQKKAMIFVRESGAIDNQTYRQLSAVDTLTASTDLRRLRDLNLLRMKGKGSKTYYVAGDNFDQETTQNEEKTHQLEAKTHQLDPKTHQLEAKTHQFELPESLKTEIDNLGKSPRREKTREIIIKLCQIQPLSADEIAKILKKTDKRNFVRSHLNKMVKDGDLQYVYDMVNHPDQKYCIKQGGGE